jgi:assimilatory nitrate reductase catalytic subunit
MPQFDFASVRAFGRERTGVLFRAAAHEPPDASLIERIEGLLGLNTPDTLRYADRRLGQRRTPARLVKQGDTTRWKAFLLAGDTRAESGSSPCCRTSCLPAPTAACC